VRHLHLEELSGLALNVDQAVLEKPYLLVLALGVSEDLLAGFRGAMLGSLVGRLEEMVVSLGSEEVRIEDVEVEKIYSGSGTNRQ
jgi:hypothetical protein